MGGNGICVTIVKEEKVRAGDIVRAGEIKVGIEEDSLTVSLEEEVCIEKEEKGDWAPC